MTLTWTIARAGIAHGIGMWFDAVLAEGIGFSNAHIPIVNESGKIVLTALDLMTAGKNLGESELVGELVEPSYNFLSLYNNLGICRVHMDAPYAKYTLDVCIDRSHSWPIYFSQVQEWPEELKLGADWEREIIANPANIFTECDLNPRQSIIFSGSSQWHYRQRIPQQVEHNFCHLLFFHFLPQGMSKTIDPRNWAILFDIPELSQIVAKSRGIIEEPKLQSISASRCKWGG